MNPQESIRKVLKEEDRYDDKVGRIFWFEYHCYESPESCDSEIWYRSHQKVKVLKVVEWSYDDENERLEDGNPRVYLVEWEDGFQYDVFEDELLESPNEFERSDPPNMNLQESIRKVLKEYDSDKMIKLVGEYLKIMHPKFNKKDVSTEEYTDERGYSVIIFREPETYLGKYHYGTNELQLSKVLFNELEGLFNDEMVYVIDWFNNEFDENAEYVTY